MIQKSSVTLNDIARKLNVSKVTVSKALRDHPDISAATKEKVHRAVTELGYMPNYVARNLSARKSNTIGLVVPKIAHHFFAEVIEAVFNTATQHQYETIMAVSQENAEKELRHLQTLLSMRVDGLLISCAAESSGSEIYHTIKARGVPLVFFDRVVKNLGFTTVTCADRKGARQLVDHLIISGYRRIAHFAGYEHTYIGHERRRGYESAMNDAGLGIDPDWIITGGFAQKDGSRALKMLAEKGNLPEVIFAVTYPVALGIYMAAEELHLRIPDDIDVVSFGGSEFNRFISPTLTYIDQPAELIGRKATELLLEEITNPDRRKIRHIELPVTLVYCQTCKSKEKV
jgi:LacI family transcriptional regulator